MRRPLKIGVRVVVSAALAFVLLELGLRVLALFLGGGADPEAIEPRRDGEKIVLCVGDSFTFGMGASTRSGAYPAQLEQRLRGELGEEWRVVNAGRPGRDSYGVLAELDRQLRTYRPNVVCVLVGVNDGWRRRGRLPSGVVSDDEESGLRTVRLFKLIARGMGLFDDEAEQATDGDAGDDRVDLTDHPLVGHWQVTPGGVEATFWPDGEGKLGGAPWEWSVVDDAVVLRAEGQELRMTVETVEKSLVLRPVTGEPMILVPAGSLSDAERGSRQLYVEFLQACGVQDYVKATELGEKWLAGGPRPRTEELAMLPQLADAHFTIGQQADAGRAVARLRELHAESPDLDTHASLSLALYSLGQYEESYRLAMQGLELPVASLDPIIRPLAMVSQMVLAVDEVKALLEQLMSRTDQLSDRSLAWLQLRLPLLLDGAEKHDDMATRLVEAQRLAPDTPAIVRACQLARAWGVDSDLVRRRAVEAGLPPESIESLLTELVGTPVGEADSWERVLGEHLQRIVETAKSAGAEVVFSGYPFRKPEVYAAQIDAAERSGVPFIEVYPRFPEDEAERSKLRVADGHCNDEGYALMAEVIAETLIPRLRGN